MGWNEGGSLGNTNTGGLKEPVCNLLIFIFRILKPLFSDQNWIAEESNWTWSGWAGGWSSREAICQFRVRGCDTSTGFSLRLLRFVPRSSFKLYLHGFVNLNWYRFVPMLKLTYYYFRFCDTWTAKSFNGMKLNVSLQRKRDENRSKIIKELIIFLHQITCLSKM